MNRTNEVHHRSSRWLPPLAIALSLLLVMHHNTWAAGPDPAAARFRSTGKADPIRIADLKKAAGPAGQSAITFDLAWDHSWRAAWEVPGQAHGGKGTLKLESWDAAWVFVKFRKAGADGWSHATLSAQASDHVAPAAAKLDVGLTDDGAKGVGVFAYRAAAGSGPNDLKAVTLRWLHEADGVTDPGATEVKVFAIQMVLVPECAYWLGDGSTTRVVSQFSAGDTAAPFRVESEDAITLGGESPANLGARDGLGVFRQVDDFGSGIRKTLPARFPKGYAAFYCMRNELTEGQFVEHLNALSSAEQLPPPITKGAGARPGPGPLLPFEEKDIVYNGIRVVTPGEPGMPAVYTTATPLMPCDGLVKYEHTRYATWAGLRPMTELEYEKACRGPLRPVADEFAWGTVAIAGKDFDKKTGGPRDGYVVSNAGGPHESVSWQGADGPDATRGNAVWNGAVRHDAKGGVPADALKNYLRGSVFATPQSDRIAAGASYWGIMELSGSLQERVVTVGNIAGRRFAGTHGAWPAPFATTGEGGDLRFPEDWGWGFGTRGGGKAGPSVDLRTSDRLEMNGVSDQNPARFRHSNQQVGFRAVRTVKVVPYELKPEQTVVASPYSPNGGKVLQSAGQGWDNCAVEVANVTVNPRDAKTATISFDVAWSESWRTEHNHDAAWVFFKARSGDPAGWQHVKLVADRVVNPTGSGQAEGDTKVDLIVPDGPDGFTGAFIRRAAPGGGPLKASRVTVLCDANTVKGIAADSKDLIRAIGIQMVYVPEGEFSLGAGGPEVGSFHQYTDGKDRSKPYRVAGPGPIPTGKKQGQLWAGNHGGPLVDGSEIPSAYPNGYAPFYCMKFQISPAQYANFLNALDPKQADERYAGHDRCVFNTVVYSGKNGRVLKDPKGGYTSVPGRERGGPGCFGLSWADGAAFAAWAGLRPMTELELEKAVRGPRDSVPDELGPSYWGVGGFGGVNWDAFKGDPQCERPVTASAPGLRFKGTHGAGTTALPADWPQADAVGSGVRCTHYSSLNLERLRGAVEPPGFFQLNTITPYELPRARLSDRLFAGIADPQRLWSHKWRGVRTAPKGVGP